MVCMIMSVSHALHTKENGFDIGDTFHTTIDNIVDEVPSLDNYIQRVELFIIVKSVMKI